MTDNCEKIIKKDMNILGLSDKGLREKFISDNQENYEIFLVSYRSYCDDALAPVDYLKNCDLHEVIQSWFNQLVSIGLIKFARRCKALESALLSNNLLSDPVDVLHNGIVEILTGSSLSSGYGTEDILCSILNILRYPKRFNAILPDSYERDAIKSFLDRNELCGMINKNITQFNHHSELLSRIRSYISTVIDDHFIAECRKVLYDIFSFRPSANYACKSLPNGATYEGYHTVLEKLVDCLGWFPTPIYGYEISQTLNNIHFDINMSDWISEFDHDTYMWLFMNYAQNISRLSCVPKDLEKSRVINIEECWRTTAAGPISDMLVKQCYERTSGAINLFNNEPSRSLAVLGCRGGKFGTTDMSAASDSLSVEIIRSVFPQPFVDIVDHLRSHVTIVNDEAIKLNVFTLMGSRFTMAIQSLLYWAVYNVAADYVCTFGNRSRLLHTCTVYGDDVNGHSDVCQTYCDIMTCLGWSVNYDKTYFSNQDLDLPSFVGRYRESCGIQVLYNKKTKKTLTFEGVYYPRTHLTSDTFDGISGLLGFQHNLAAAGFNKTARVIGEYLKAGCPKLTESEVGSVYDDLWYEQPRLTYESIPLYALQTRASSETAWQFIGYSDQTREVHYELTPVYDRKSLKANNKTIVDHYLYASWLETGPAYSDELQEILRIPDHRDSASLLYEISGYTVRRRG